MGSKNIKCRDKKKFLFMLMKELKKELLSDVYITTAHVKQFFLR